jgi:tyrosine-protein kinase Etk/Wzc
MESERMSFRILHFVLERRRIILTVTAVCLVIALLYVFIADRKYESRALLMPPLEEGGGGMLATWMAQMNIPTTTIPMTAGTTSAAVLVDILLSRRLGEYVVVSLDLRERYDVSSMEKALKRLRGRTVIAATNTGFIRLGVLDEDPVFAAEIARCYIAGLDSLNRFLEYGRAEQTISFISTQIERYREELGLLRGKITLFQEEHGIIHFEEQVRGAIEVAANIKLQATLARIERDLLREFAKDNAIELKRKEAEYQNLSRQLEVMMEGDTSSSVFFPLAEMPVLSQEYAAMERDLEVSEKVYSYLLQRYEEAGVDRARNTPTVQVVDEPSISEKPAGLRAWVILLFAALSGFVWSSVMLVWWGWLHMRRRTEEEQRALREVGELLRGDVEWLRRRLRL